MKPHCRLGPGSAVTQAKSSSVDRASYPEDTIISKRGTLPTRAGICFLRASYK